MAGTNTEKPTGNAKEKKQIVKTPKKTKEVLKAPVQPKEENKTTNVEEDKPKTEEKKEKVEVKKIKKNETSVVGENLPVSRKVAISVCKFISQKKVEKAIEELEMVMKLKKAVPMKGEYPHRKGKIMSGRYPVKAAKEFLTLLKSLRANAIQHDIEEPTITEAVANKGTTVYASGGRVKKRVHVRIVCKQKEKKK